MIPLLFLVSLLSQPHTVSGNFPRDLYGPVDTRMAGQSCDVGPCIYGHADSSDLPIQFYPPAGMRIRILSLRGDLIAWIKDTRESFSFSIPPNSMAGVLAGFQASSSGASTDCNYCASGCPLYIQDAVGEKIPLARAPFDYENVGMVLDADNVLHAKIAEFLNTTDHPIHLELTYTIQFVFE